MVLAYIDTNVFLDFYQSSTDRLSVFQDIVARASNILLTEQTISEFRRNRTARLTLLAKEIRAAAAAPVYTTAVVQALPGFKDWVNAKESAKRAAGEIVAELTSWIDDEQSDPVLMAFEKLVAASPTISTTDALIQRAHRRKLLGQPPTSPGKQTIGDELNWECLLTWRDSDIVVVSRDSTFLDNQALLKREFSAATGRALIKVTGSLAAGLELIGQASERIKAAEQVPSFKLVQAQPTRTGGLLQAPCRCAMCGMELCGEADHATLEHLLPFAARYGTTLDNLLVVCRNCNWPLKCA